MNSAPVDERDSDRDLPVSPAVGCLGALALGILGALVVFSGLKLAVQGELRLGGGDLTPRRAWLVTGPDNAGLAYESSRIVTGSRTEGEACVHTAVSFFFWRRDETAQPVDFCECYQRQGETWQYSGTCELEDAGGGSQ